MHFPLVCHAGTSVGFSNTRIDMEGLAGKWNSIVVPVQRDTPACAEMNRLQSRKSTGTAARVPEALTDFLPWALKEG